MLTVVILTYDEEVHIRRAVENVRDWAADIFILDSYSVDRTREISAEAGAQVFQHRFENYAAQREWALRHLPYRTEWMLFLDADELVSEPLKGEVLQVLAETPSMVNGYYIKRRFYWMGRWVRRGGVYPTWILRLVRHRAAHCNSRPINEHLEVEGETRNLEYDLLHKELTSISHWIVKHNRYAQLEAAELLKSEKQNQSDSLARFWGTQAENKRWIRERVWNRWLPPLFRPFLFFAYRYFFRLGFLDGRAGFIYHFLQGLWFPFLIDVKFIELKHERGRNWKTE